MEKYLRNAFIPLDQKHVCEKNSEYRVEFSDLALEKNP